MRLILTALTMMILAAPAGALAQDGTERTYPYEKRHNAWENLSPEEQAAKKEQRRMRVDERRSQWQALSEEERNARKAQHQEKKAHRRATAKDKYQGLDPQQQQRVQQRFERKQDFRQGRRDSRRDLYNR